MSRDANVPLDVDLVSRMRTGAVFDASGVNAVDFSTDGSLLVAAADDDSLSIVDATAGQLRKTLLFKEHGVARVKFTHHSSAVLCASNKPSSGLIMYHSVVDNQYLRLFRGHSDRVCSLSLSPVDDSFISCSLDSTVMLWDLRSNEPQARLLTGRQPCAQYDPKGLVFACVSDPSCVRLFDMRSYQQGPFASFSLIGPPYWNQVEFSPDGTLLALSSPSNMTVLLDAFSGDHRSTLEHANASFEYEVPIAFSPDGKFIVSGTDIGSLHVWDATSAGKVAELQDGHSSAILCVKCHPTLAMVASGADHLSLWIPAATKDE